MSRVRAGLLWLLAWWLRLPRIVRVLAPLAIMVFLWVSSSKTPTSKPPSVVRALLHNGAHVVAYFALGGAWLLTLLGRGGEVFAAWTTRLVAATIALAVLYGVVDEVHQAYVPGRHSSFWDMASDAVGAVLGVAFVAWLTSGEARRGWRCAALVGLAVLTVLAATFLPG
ncbi:MAG: VanZ family protein [bacterium]|nr:VanZ family protein [bacterium]